MIVIKSRKAIYEVDIILGVVLCNVFYVNGIPIINWIYTLYIIFVYYYWHVSSILRGLIYDYLVHLKSINPGTQA